MRTQKEARYFPKRGDLWAWDDTQQAVLFIITIDINNSGRFCVTGEPNKFIGGAADTRWFKSSNVFLGNILDGDAPMLEWAKPWLL